MKDGELAAARADLRAAAVTERRFDRQMIALWSRRGPNPSSACLPRRPGAGQLTSTAAGVSSLNELRGYQRRLDAASGPVEAAVQVIRAQLGLPPPDIS